MAGRRGRRNRNSKLEFSKRFFGNPDSSRTLAETCLDLTFSTVIKPFSSRSFPKVKHTTYAVINK
jgi:hypothetical protein